MTRRQTTARNVAAGVELFVLAAALTACALSSGGSVASPTTGVHAGLVAK